MKLTALLGNQRDLTLHNRAVNQFPRYLLPRIIKVNRYSTDMPSHAQTNFSCALFSSYIWSLAKISAGENLIRTQEKWELKKPDTWVTLGRQKFI